MNSGIFRPTVNGCAFAEVVSALQNDIRRGNEREAMFAEITLECWLTDGHILCSNSVDPADDNRLLPNWIEAASVSARTATSKRPILAAIVRGGVIAVRRKSPSSQSPVETGIV